MTKDQFKNITSLLARIAFALEEANKAPTSAVKRKVVAPVSAPVGKVEVTKRK